MIFFWIFISNLIWLWTESLCWSFFICSISGTCWFHFQIGVVFLLSCSIFIFADAVIIKFDENEGEAWKTEESTHNKFFDVVWILFVCRHHLRSLLSRCSGRSYLCLQLFLDFWNGIFILFGGIFGGFGRCSRCGWMRRPKNFGFFLSIIISFFLFLINFRVNIWNTNHSYDG